MDSSKVAAYDYGKEQARLPERKYVIEYAHEKSDPCYLFNLTK